MNPLADQSSEVDVSDRLADYVRGALKTLCSSVSQGVKDGDRNIRLKKAAYCMGTFDHLRVIPRDEVTNALATAARSVGLEDAEIGATIDSAFSSGQRRPQSIEFEATDISS